MLNEKMMTRIFASDVYVDGKFQTIDSYSIYNNKPFTMKEFEEVLEYFQAHTETKEVIVYVDTVTLGTWYLDDIKAYTVHLVDDRESEPSGYFIIKEEKSKTPYIRIEIL